MNRKNYHDIETLDRPRSVRHPPMSLESRAAQFAPFAALNGYEAAVNETARLTDEMTEFDEGVIDELNEKLRCLAERINERPRASITYFKEDLRKAGGAYVRAEGRIREIDEVEHRVILSDGTKIPMEQICCIES